MRRAFRLFPLATTTVAATTTTISAATPTSGVLRCTLTATLTAAVSATIAPTCTGAATRTSAFQSVVSVIRAEICPHTAGVRLYDYVIDILLPSPALLTECFLLMVISRSCHVETQCIASLLFHSVAFAIRAEICPHTSIHILLAMYRHRRCRISVTPDGSLGWMRNSCIFAAVRYESAPKHQTISPRK